MLPCGREPSSDKRNGRIRLVLFNAHRLDLGVVPSLANNWHCIKSSRCQSIKCVHNLLSSGSPLAVSFGEAGNNLNDLKFYQYNIFYTDKLYARVVPVPRRGMVEEEKHISEYVNI